MRTKGAVMALILVGLLTATLAVTAAAEQGTTSPPRNLKKVGDHWTPWDPPAANPDDYIIQKGDTLWDLAGEWLGNPYLWPQVWDQNRYVLDSHWIYPGDPLVRPGKPTVVPAEGPPPGTEETAPTGAARRDEGRPAAAPAAAPAPLLPVADSADVYCAGFIDPQHEPSEMRIAGRELEREHVAQGDVVYLNRGRAEGIAAGTEFAVIRPTSSVRHPDTGDPMGVLVRRLARLRVLVAQEATATAVIEFACEDIVDGDEVIPWQEIPIPRVSSLPPFDRYDAEPSGGEIGRVVAAKDDLSAVGGGYVVYTDLGGGQGVRPGDFLTVFRDNGDLPRLMLGQAVVLEARDGSSLAKVTRAVREIRIGDRVEVTR